MRVLIYVNNLRGLGGIERVVREHLRIFPSHGVECKVYGEHGGDYEIPIDGEARSKALKEIVATYKPDVAILHGFDRDDFHLACTDDQCVFRAAGVKVVGVCHFSFPSGMLLDTDEMANRNFLIGAKECDMIATVSRIDMLYWRALGCRAMHVQNPFVHPRPSKGRPSTVNLNLQPHPIELLWVGRNCEQKRPDLAIEVMARVVAAAPNVHLTMIGGDDAGWNGIRKLAAKLKISDKVTCLGQREDLNDLWEKTDIHLLTSVTESFCLVLAEAKAKGVPTAMFEIPFLELVESDEGLLTAPQGDVNELSDKIIDLIQNYDKRLALGNEAQKSLTAFNDESVWQSWVCVFESLRSGEGCYSVDADFKTIVTQQYFAWNNFCEKNLWMIQMVRDVSKLTRGIATMRGVAKCLSNMVKLMQGIMKLKRSVRP